MHRLIARYLFQGRIFFCVVGPGDEGAESEVAGDGTWSSCVTSGVSRDGGGCVGSTGKLINEDGDATPL